MEVRCYYLISLLVISFNANEAVLTPEDYWKSILPNTVMPKSISNLLCSELKFGSREAKNVSEEDAVTNALTNSILGYDDDSFRENNEEKIFTSSIRRYGYNGYNSFGEGLEELPNMTTFFLKKDMEQGNVFKIHFSRSTVGDCFLPRYLAEKIPFSSNKLREILNRFSVRPDSPNAKVFQETISTCEMAGVKGEEKYCVTSVESMVDYITSKVGKNVKVIAGEVDNEPNHLQNYTFASKEDIPGEKTFVCHKLNYVYAVFNCHKLLQTKAYNVSLVGSNGTKARAIAVCHADTAAWNPKHLSFRVVKVKPGTFQICHFLFNDAVAWISKK